MRIEVLPLVAGIIVGLIGLTLLVDAMTPDEVLLTRERRRRPRIERSRRGEMAIGLGMLAMAAALFGRDTWRYSVVSVIAGAVLLAAGAISNRRYLAQVVANRGTLRRRE